MVSEDLTGSVVAYSALSDFVHNTNQEDREVIYRKMIDCSIHQQNLIIEKYLELGIGVGNNRAATTSGGVL